MYKNKTANYLLLMAFHNYIYSKAYKFFLIPE